MKKTKAEQVIELFNYGILREIFDNDAQFDDETFGGMLFIDSLRAKIVARYIDDFAGQIRFVSLESFEKIKKNVSYKVGAHCRILRGEKEKQGAEKVRQFLIDKLSKIK